MTLTWILIIAVAIQTTTAKYDTIIVGAGASGLAAATRLLELNVTNFIVLEAESRTGGRIHSEAFAGRMMDMGAQWCQGEEGNVVYQLANPKGLLHHNLKDLPTSKSWTIDANGNSCDPKQVNRIMGMLDDIIGGIRFSGDAENLKAYVEREFAEVLKQPENIKIDRKLARKLVDLYGKLFCSDYACSNWSQFPNIAAYKNAMEYEKQTGDLYMSWGNGTFGDFLPVLMTPNISTTKTVAERILHNKEVKTIFWHDFSGPSVECLDGSKYFASHLIVTVSLGVLQHRKDLFEPQLPAWKTQAIGNLNMGCSAKIYLKFNESWWGQDENDFNFFVEPQESENWLKNFNGSVDENKWLLDVNAFHTVDWVPNILEGWTYGNAAQYIETLPDKVIADKVMQMLRLQLKNVTIPDPIAFKRSRWCMNPHFYGTYSWPAMNTANNTHAQLAAPLNIHEKPLVLFAGEATNSDLYASVQGAIATGYREAERLHTLL